MSLGLPRGARVFVDANIFHYALVNIPPYSQPVFAFMERLVGGEFQACTTTQILSDAIHKTMASEAAEQFGLSRGNLVAWMQRNADQIRGLRKYRQGATMLASLPLQILPIDLTDLLSATTISGECGLLTNDAIAVAVMRRHGLRDIATNDEDFDRATELTVWKPR